MGRVLRQLEALDRELQARVPHPLLGTGSLHASTIEGGRELSSYPDRARLQMERRTLPTESAANALDEVRAILDALVLEDSAFAATARRLFARPAYELSAEHELPVMLAEAIRHLSGNVRLEGASFWTDAAVLGHSGIPSVLFGPRGAGLHSTEEYVNLEDIVFCREVLADLARRFC
jgi:acetylornithine deacetylase